MRRKNLFAVAFASLCILLIAGCGNLPETPNPDPDKKPDVRKPPVEKQMAKLTVNVSAKVDKLLLNGSVWKTDVQGTMTEEIKPGEYTVLARLKGMVTPDDFNGGKKFVLSNGENKTLDFDLSQKAVDLRNTICDCYMQGKKVNSQFQLKMYMHENKIWVNLIEGIFVNLQINEDKLYTKSDKSETKGTVTINGQEILIKVTDELIDGRKAETEYRCQRASTD